MAISEVMKYINPVSSATMKNNLSNQQIQENRYGLFI